MTRPSEEKQFWLQLNVKESPASQSTNDLCHFFAIKKKGLGSAKPSADTVHNPMNTYFVSYPPGYFWKIHINKSTFAKNRTKKVY